VTGHGWARRVATTLDCAWQAGRDAWDVLGRRAREAAANPVDPVPPGLLEVPADDAAAGAVLAVRGWLRHDLGYDRVELRVGDAPAQRARLLAHPRPDLAATIDEPAAAMAGWEALVDLPRGPGPRVEELVVEALGRAGRVELGRRSVAVRPPVEARCDDPARLAVVAARAGAVAAGHRPRTGGVHLLVVTHDLGLGGGQLYLQEMLRHLLAAEDVSCTVLASVDGVLRDELEGWGARVHVTGPVPVEGLAYETRMLELAALGVTSRANVVLANTTGSFWGVDLAGRLGVPAVWSIHESFAVDHFVEVAFGTRPDAHVIDRLRGALADAAAVVFEADATRRLYEPDLGPGRSVRIDYGIDLGRIDRYRSDHGRDHVRAALGFGPDDRVLVCIGTYEPRKAQAALAVAFARAATDHPDARLALVGDNGTAYATGLHDLVDRLGLADRIHLEPVTPDIDAWYLAADGFVLASDVESLPRSMLEAMAHGVPVIVSSVFGVPEVIADGDNGLLFEPLCLASLTATMGRFLALAPDDRWRIGTHGRHHAETVRPAKYYADAYRRLCEVLVDDPRALPAEALRRP
jgi:glycosyltransferase involved in cell wall biosynthesis